MIRWVLAAVSCVILGMVFFVGQKKNESGVTPNNVVREVKEKCSDKFIKNKSEFTKLTNNSQILTAQPQAPQPMAEVVIKGLKLKDIEKSKGYEVTIDAQESKFFYVPNTVECYRVWCTLHEHQQAVAFFKSDRALVNRTQKSVFLSGVVNGTFKGLVLSGKNIFYNFSQQTLSTQDAFSCQHPEFYVCAKKSFANMKDNTIAFGGNVQSVFTARDTLQQQ
jgi:hypothetical protein